MCGDLLRSIKHARSRAPETGKASEIILERKWSRKLEIRVNSNDVEKALKLLKRKLEKDGLIGDLNKKRFYEKPSAKLRSKQREARKRTARSKSRKIQNRRGSINK